MGGTGDGTWKRCLAEGEGYGYYLGLLKFLLPNISSSNRQTYYDLIFMVSSNQKSIISIRKHGGGTNENKIHDVNIFFSNFDTVFCLDDAIH